MYRGVYAAGRRRLSREGQFMAAVLRCEPGAGLMGHTAAAHWRVLPEGLARLRRLLDRRTFRVTRSKLERHFLAICRRAGLPLPLTRVVVNGYEVDFYWPELGLVVESDGLTYHRTPAEQAVDIEREHAHVVGRLTPLRFTHYQVVHEPAYVESVLVAVFARLRATLPAHGATGLGRR